AVTLSDAVLFQSVCHTVDAYSDFFVREGTNLSVFTFPHDSWACADSRVFQPLVDRVVGDVEFPPDVPFWPHVTAGEIDNFFVRLEPANVQRLFCLTPKPGDVLDRRLKKVVVIVKAELCHPSVQTRRLYEGFSRGPYRLHRVRHPFIQS